MVVNFRKEFVAAFSCLPAAKQKRAKGFVRVLRHDLEKKIKSLHQFPLPILKTLQSIPYEIGMVSTNSIASIQKKFNLTLGPDDAVFSILGSGFIVMFLLNYNNPGTIEILTIGLEKTP